MSSRLIIVAKRWCKSSVIVVHGHHTLDLVLVGDEEKNDDDNDNPEDNPTCAHFGNAKI